MQKIEPDFGAIQKALQEHCATFSSSLPYNVRIQDKHGGHSYKTVDAAVAGDQALMMALLTANEEYDSFKAAMRMGLYSNKEVLSLVVNGVRCDMKKSKLFHVAVAHPQRRVVISLWLNQRFALQQNAEALYVLMDNPHENKKASSYYVHVKPHPSVYMLTMMGQYLGGWLQRGNKVAGLLDCPVLPNWYTVLWREGCEANLIRTVNDTSSTALRVVMVEGKKTEWTEILTKAVRDRKVNF